MHKNEIWVVKKFQNKLELDKYLSEKGYILTTIRPRLKSCRFCLGENPNESTHMVQAYLFCQKCINKQNKADEIFCAKTNICFFLKRFELLTKHPEASSDSSDSASSPMNIDLFGNIFTNLPGIKDRYYQTKDFFTWNVKNIFPNQCFLFSERYIMKINDRWFEFQNGKEKHLFKVEGKDENFNEIKLLRDDFKLFRLDSTCLFNITDNIRECEGKWILDLNSKIPCISCSRELNRMVFDCDIHLEANFYGENSKITSTQTNKVWKANEKNEKKYFKRRDFETWEEYCNDKLTDTFKFIGFSENNDIIIRRNSRLHPDYLRLTNNELFIGKFKDFIYTPVYSGSWSKCVNSSMN